MSRKFTVRLSSQARSDLISIKQYIVSNFADPVNADKIIATIEKRTMDLSSNYSYKLVQDEPFFSLGYRQVRVKHYLIIYTVNEKDQTIDIIAIIYAGRNLPNLLT